ncbi:MAG: hypothetical protein ACM338_03510 [Betaproteobacteria bacterium]
MNTVELFLIALALVFSVPYLVWRLGRTEYWAPLVVVQIVTGIVLGPGVLGAAPRPYAAGSWGPSSAVALVERDGRTWHEDTDLA